MRTVSVRRASPDQPYDFDGNIVDGIESLRQRVRQAILFRLGTWFANVQRGVPYDELIGHQTTSGLAASTITEAIIEEGDDEVKTVDDVVSSLDHNTREFSYSAHVITVYGDMPVTESIAI